MTPQVIFIHIEKTAGSSIEESLIKANIVDKEHTRVRGIRGYLQNRDLDCVYGHVPYGLHFFTHRPVHYVAMLRDPIDRAVSWYYFIKDLVRTDLWKRHPLRDYADSVTLIEFYESPWYANIQTRFLAGLVYNKLYPYLHNSSVFRRSMLKSAIHTLHACTAFGLQSRFDESISLFQKTLNWNNYQPVPPQAKTKRRPSLEEIQNLNPKVLPGLRKSHDLDHKLYEIASELFDRKIKNLKSSQINV